MAPNERILWVILRDGNLLPEERESVRQELLGHYLPLVRLVVGRLALNFPSATIESSDMIQSGVLGLMEALERFDADLNIEFRTYAQARIRGAVLDELRSLDWAPRSVRDKARQLSQTTAALNAELKRPPTADETAQALGLSPPAFQRLLEEAQARSVRSLEALMESEGESETWPSLNPDVEDAALFQDLVAGLRDGLGRLADRDRLLIQRYYEHDRTLREIAEEFGVTESRVCQIHAVLLGRLKGWVDERLKTQPSASMLYRQLSRS